MGMKPNAAPAERFWMVVREDSLGKLPKKKHPTQEAAIAEADRLASANQGSVFHVLESIGFAQKLVPSTFTWVAD
jgi:hypothetical protein